MARSKRAKMLTHLCLLKQHQDNLSAEAIEEIFVSCGQNTGGH